MVPALTSYFLVSSDITLCFFRSSVPGNWKVVGKIWTLVGKCETFLSSNLSSILVFRYSWIYRLILCYQHLQWFTPEILSPVLSIKYRVPRTINRILGFLSPSVCGLLLLPMANLIIMPCFLPPLPVHQVVCHPLAVKNMSLLLLTSINLIMLIAMIQTT